MDWQPLPFVKFVFSAEIPRLLNTKDTTSRDWRIEKEAAPRRLWLNMARYKWLHDARAIAGMLVQIQRQS